MALTLCSLNASIHRFTRVRCTAISLSSIGTTFPFITKFSPYTPTTPATLTTLATLSHPTFLYRHDFSLYYKIVPYTPTTPATLTTLATLSHPHSNFGSFPLVSLYYILSITIWQSFCM